MNQELSLLVAIQTVKANIKQVVKEQQEQTNLPGYLIDSILSDILLEYKNSSLEEFTVIYHTSKEENLAKAKE